MNPFEDDPDIEVGGDADARPASTPAQSPAESPAKRLARLSAERSPTLAERNVNRGDGWPRMADGRAEATAGGLAGRLVLGLPQERTEDHEKSPAKTASKKSLKSEDPVAGPLGCFKKTSKISSFTFATTFLLPGIVCLGVVTGVGGSSTLWIVTGVLLGTGITGFIGAGVLFFYVKLKTRKRDKKTEKAKESPSFRSIHAKQREKIKKYGIGAGAASNAAGEPFPWNNMDRESQVSSVVDPLLAEEVFDERADKMRSFILKGVDAQ